MSSRNERTSARARDLTHVAGSILDWARASQSSSAAFPAVCNKGWCQYDLWCTSNKQCGSNYFCDTKAGRCVAKEITCDWPYKFNGYYCVLPTLECSCNTPCPSNQWCYYGKCIEGKSGSLCASRALFLRSSLATLVPLSLIAGVFPNMYMTG